MEALAALPFWEDDGPDIHPWPGSHVFETKSPDAPAGTGLDFSKTLQSALYGAISAVAFAFGELAGDPSKGTLEDLFSDIAWAVFGALLSELVTCLTGNVLLSVLIVGFVTGFLVVILSS